MSVNVVGVVILPYVLAMGGVLWGLAMRLDAKRQREDVARLDAALAEAGRVLWSFRDLFDHAGAYVGGSPELKRLAFWLASALPHYVEDLPCVSARAEVTRDFPILRGFGDIEYLVKKINDPVLIILWEIRTPSALSEMLRHTYFLNFGYPNAVVGEWDRSAISIEIPDQFEPNYTNWGALSIAGLQEKTGRYWYEIAKVPSKHLPRRIVSRVGKVG